MSKKNNYYYKKNQTKKNYYTKLSKETIDKLFQEISRGVPIKHACTITIFVEISYKNCSS